MLNGRCKMLSYDERSSAHRNDFPRSSIDAGKKRNMAIRIGNWISIGIQPPIGLTPALLYSAIIACCFFIASSCFGYFSLSLSISGFSRRILAVER